MAWRGIVALAVVASLQIGWSNAMSIDQMIFQAADKMAMFDLTHMMDDQMMVMVEYDILMNLTELAEFKDDPEGRFKRKGTSFNSLLWPSGQVGYEINTADFSASDIATIRRGIEIWQNYTCLTFNEVSTGDRIFFRTGGGCYSRLGRTGGQQPIGLANGCRVTGIVVHEIGHAIGWYHEQARPDRDGFIRVNYDQIPTNWHPQFDKVAASRHDARGVTYDYLSIMHYRGNVFGPNTIVTLDSRFQNLIGQRLGMSYGDIKLANLMYQCGANCQNPPTCPQAGFLGKDCRCYCPPDEAIYPTENPLQLCANAPTAGPQPSTAAPLPTTPAPQPTTAAPQPTTGSAACEDVSNNCANLKAAGNCESDQARMRTFCRRTCGFCTSDTCMDLDPACSFYASSGFCNRRGIRRFVRRQCELSCGLCTPSDPCSAFRDTSGAASYSPSKIAAISVASVVSLLIALI